VESLPSTRVRVRVQARRKYVVLFSPPLYGYKANCRVWYCHECGNLLPTALVRDHTTAGLVSSNLPDIRPAQNVKLTHCNVGCHAMPIASHQRSACRFRCQLHVPFACFMSIHSTDW
jgi:hypothetical protein